MNEPRSRTDSTIDATPPAQDSVLNEEAVLSPFKAIEWQQMSPAERLARAWALRKRLVDPRAAHDSKIFPAP
jgi:hypothetical protein